MTPRYSMWVGLAEKRVLGRCRCRLRQRRETVACHHELSTVAKPASECMDDLLWTIGALRRSDSCRQVDLAACHGLSCPSRPGQAAAAGLPHRSVVGAPPTRPCCSAMVVHPNDTSRCLPWVGATWNCPRGGQPRHQLQQQPGEEDDLDVAVFAPHPRPRELEAAP
jgi:hypothetical protein